MSINRELVTVMAKDYLIYNKSIQDIAVDMDIDPAYVSQSITQFLSTPKDMKMIASLLAENSLAPVIGFKNEPYYKTEKELMESPLKFPSYREMIQNEE